MAPTTYPELVRKAWPVFLEAVRMGRTVSYSELAGRAGPPLHHRHIHHQLLVPLSARCRLCGLPDLAALVVRKDTGMPGAGWYVDAPGGDPDAAWADAVLACLRHQWPGRPAACLLKAAPVELAP